MRWMTLSCAFLLLLTACERAQNPKPPAPQPQQAAQDAIGVLQKLVNAENYKSLGFDSVDEVKQAQLGQPMEIFNIPLDKLKSYQSGSDPNSLLSQSSETMYPVTVGGQAKSSVTIMKKENGYTASSFGNAPIARGLSRNQSTGQGDFVVRVPALNFYFVGRRVENFLVLVPIVDDPRLGVKAGEAVPAERLLPQMVIVANEYNGLPM